MQLNMVWEKQRIGEFTLPEGFQIRTYVDGDALGWLHACADGLNIRWNEEEFVRNMLKADGIRPEGVFFIINDKQEIIGTATGMFTPEPGSGYLHMVSIVPEYRGLGLSKPLIAAVLNYLVSHGCTRVTLHTDDERIPAIKSYVAFGFRPILFNDVLRFRWQKVMANAGYSELKVYLEGGCGATVLKSRPLLPLDLTDNVYLVDPDTGVYLVLRDKRGFLVDSPNAERVDDVIASLKQMDVSGCIEGIMCTHCYPWNVDGYVQLSMKLNVPLYAGCSHVWSEYMQNLQDEGLECSMLRVLSEDTSSLCVGGFDIDVFHIPGYVRGAIAYRLFDESLMFVGDLLQYSGCRNRHNWMGIIEDAQLLRESLMKIRDQNFEIMLTSFGGFDVDLNLINKGRDSKGDIDTSISTLDALLGEIHHLLKDGAGVDDIYRYLKTVKKLSNYSETLERMTAKALVHAAGNIDIEN